MGLGILESYEVPTREINNESILLMIAKIANSTVNKLSTDNSDILYSPSNGQELDENTNMLNNIISLKIKNNIIKN